MKYGMIRVSAAAPAVTLADPRGNADAILSEMRRAAAGGSALLVTPALSLTGATCGDLFRSDALLRAAQDALLTLAQASAELPILAFVGLPLAVGGAIYSCVAGICAGAILGVVPKQYLTPEERRVFTPAPAAGGEIVLGGQAVPFGRDLLFACREMASLVVGVEFGDALWQLSPPSSALAAAGATVIAAPASDAELVGRAARRRHMVLAQSERILGAYLYVTAGKGESTTDNVYGGHAMIAAGGASVAENEPIVGDNAVSGVVDLAHLLADRRHNGTVVGDDTCFRRVPFSLPERETALAGRIRPEPFFPADKEKQPQRCEEILRMLSSGLASRLRASRAPGAVLAVSGGLDSCLALLVAVRAADQLGWERSRIRTVTLPCFGTTKRTRSNAELLSVALGTSFSEIDITEAVRLHFRDIGHDEAVKNVVYENVQARERTQIIMDLANGDGSLVIGTGDLSELALGWATYNGDHMSGYGVNGGVPKTLVRHLVEYSASAAERDGRDATAGALRDILATPVSPELLPAVDGEIAQKTEDIVGPYALHDFFLYYTVRYGDAPDKLLHLAEAAFDGVYTQEVIRYWLGVFTRRFVVQQFKRSCLPDGVAVGSVALSPRIAWHMPSDASAKFAL